ncbi:hypothetical protein K490DRAFT_54690 [Saccharata proteae CBS 121410]|uniref:Uncharacterized protein n=1 Tax=Saccharata proteae CBS 121410 TaxID=1314787 RepID=A0A9P4LYG3_9PEZI|nr:hypothetical protein K490DRAFT_54690 [Saccharata proteae CBS 121410]
MESPDRDWKPKNRPQSTIAREFSAALDDIFNLSGKFDNVEKEVQSKQEAMTSQTAELEALEARLRATEERLRKAGGKPAASEEEPELQSQAAPPKAGGVPLRPTRQPPTVPNPAAGKGYMMPDRPSSKGLQT